MALTILKQSAPRHIQAGQDGYTRVCGLAQFTGTDTTGNLSTKIRRIQSLNFTPLGAFEQIRCTDTPVDGVLLSGPYQQLALARSSNSSGLKFLFEYTGI